MTALVARDPQSRRDSLQREVRRSDNDVIAAWRALVQAPALQTAQLRSEIDAIAQRAVGGVRHELRAVMTEALHDHALLALGAAFVVGAWAGQRR